MELPPPARDANSPLLDPPRRTGWRSTLGNTLAKRSAELGLAPVGVVAYVEVSDGDG